VSYMEGARQQQIVAEITQAGADLTPILKGAVKAIQ